jgi:hypothetical protein
LAVEGIVPEGGVGAKGLQGLVVILDGERHLPLVRPVERLGDAPSQVLADPADPLAGQVLGIVRLGGTHALRDGLHRALVLPREKPGQREDEEVQSHGARITKVEIEKTNHRKGESFI